MLILFFHF